ncbi:hypothetical protein [Thalassobacillus pellis]|uniref:hypothetical protein n=1 Tax=Thalassobacillus pellis TaxID=748008 RepID=UPI001960B6EE|nr:hypothetical protein [Thalassobacillus pellis]MBM7553724.1 hypothetical protein [Thalassobacillus pellis]
MGYKVVAMNKKKTEIIFVNGDVREELMFETKTEAEKFITDLQSLEHMRGKYQYKIEQAELIEQIEKVKTEL